MTKRLVLWLLLNAVCYVLTFVFCGFYLQSVVLCLLISALIITAFIDFRTYEIPFGINVFIFILGIINLFFEEELIENIIGFFAVSGLLFLIYIFTKGKGMGGGDVKLMAVCGLLLGWKLIILAFLSGCFYAVVIHSIRMKVSEQGYRLAFGPYLAMGIVTAVWFGEKLLGGYAGLLI